MENKLKVTEMIKKVKILMGKKYALQRKRRKSWKTISKEKQNGKVRVKKGEESRNNKKMYRN